MSGDEIVSRVLHIYLNLYKSHTRYTFITDYVIAYTFTIFMNATLGI